jgi:hypothetical protein
MTGTDSLGVPPSPEPADDDLAPWQRNRLLRQAELDAATEHGRQLVERYGSGNHRARFAGVGHVQVKRGRRVSR